MKLKFRDDKTDAGTEAFNCSFQLTYRIDQYWYGSKLVSHNNSQPFLKKLYHEQLTEMEMAQITDIIHNQLLADIERQVDDLNK